MGISSLNSAIFYNVSLYFYLQILRHRYERHLNHANITNIPDPIHKNGPFHGRQVHFSVSVHENSHFYGREKKIQSDLSGVAAKLRQGC